jgi:hypothetical protein
MTIGQARRRIGGIHIYNASFENSHNATVPTTTISRWIDNSAGGSTSNDIYGWYLQQAGGSALLDRTAGYTGSTSLHMTLTTENSVPTVTNLDNILNIRRYGYAVLPSTTYTAVVIMKTQYNSGTASSDVGAQLQVFERDNAGVFQAQTNTALVSATTDWTSYSCTFTTQATTRFLSVKFAIVGDQGAQDLLMEAWFDSIEIYQSQSRTAVV